MKSIALHRAAVCTNKTYYGGGGYHGPTDLSGYAATRCRSPRSPAVADDMDDISVGRPSPPASAECYARLHDDDDDDDGHDSDAAASVTSSSGDEPNGADYFGPLKKLGTVRIDKMSYGISERKNYSAKRRPAALQQHKQQHGRQQQQQADRMDATTMTAAASACSASEDSSSAAPSHACGVKSFSIADILGHEPGGGTKQQQSSSAAATTAAEDGAKIVRPWAEEYHHQHHHHQRPPPQPLSLLPPPPPPPPLPPPPPPQPYGSFVSPQPPPAHRQPVGGALFPHSLFIQHLQHQHNHHLQQHRPQSADYDTSTCTSGRSSTDGSECCTSPEIANCIQSAAASSSAAPSSSAASARKHQAAGGKNNDNSSPLDALFQMTSKTFDQLHGDPSAAGNCTRRFSYLFFSFYEYDGRTMCIDTGWLLSYTSAGFKVMCDDWGPGTDIRLKRPNIFFYPFYL